ncbi:MAG: hypothetical protein HQM10_08320 [Candidatus Riflebacteria bacterium]|nr:hypothetical protein [Candidatus Riflebacteria bacterium]
MNKLEMKDWLLLLLLLVFYTFGASMFFDSFIDDAFISFRYSENLFSGNGFVYNLNDKVEGTTNFLWVILIGIFNKLAFTDIETSTLLLSYLLIISSIFLVFISAKKMLDNSWFAFLATLTLVANADFLLMSLCGLEVPLVNFLLTLLVFYSLKQKTSISRICIFLLALTRPEFMLFILIYELSGVFNTEERWFQREILQGILFSLIIIFTITSIRFIYFGDALPNTFYAKTNAQTSVFYGLNEFFAFLKSGGWLFAIVPAVFFSQRSPVEKRIMIFCFSYLVYIIVLGRNSLGYFRFYVHILPAIAPFLVHAFNKNRSFITNSVIASAIMFSPFFSFYYSDFHSMREIQNFRNECWRNIGNWLLENTTKDCLIALNPIGQIGYFSKRPIVDMLGLVDRTIAKSPLKEGRFKIFGHEKFNTEYVLTRKPDIIILRGALLQPKPFLMDDYLKTESPFLGDNELLKNSDFQKGYKLLNVPINNLFFPLFCRIASEKVNGKFK